MESIAARAASCGPYLVGVDAAAIRPGGSVELLGRGGVVSADYDCVVLVSASAGIIASCRQAVGSRPSASYGPSSLF